MSKRISWLMSLALLGLLLAASPATARGGHGGWHGGGHGWHGGGWHGGGWGWRAGGWGWRGWGWGSYYPYGWGGHYPYGWRGYYPYYGAYWAPPYAYGCGSRVIKVRRGGYWKWRRVPIRCY